MTTLEIFLMIKWVLFSLKVQAEYCRQAGSTVIEIKYGFHNIQVQQIIELLSLQYFKHTNKLVYIRDVFFLIYRIVGWKKMKL